MSVKSVPTNQNGFILAFTLWGLAAITLGSFYFASWAERSVQSAREELENLQIRQDILSTRSTLLYLVASQPLNRAGLTLPARDADLRAAALAARKNANPFNSLVKVTGTELKMDGLWYKGIGRAQFSLQDIGGLFGLYNISPAEFDRLLQAVGVPVEQWGFLTDTLLDYIDTDTLHRLNGAEEDEYERIGLPAPAGRRLLTSRELANVYGWNTKEFSALTDRISLLTAAGKGRGVNLNTAPLPVLETLESMDAQSAQNILVVRRQRPFASVADANRAAGKVVLRKQMMYSFLPSKYVRLTIGANARGAWREINLIITPAAANGAPWIIDYDIPVPRRNGLQQQEQAESFEAQDTGNPLFTP